VQLSSLVIKWQDSRSTRRELQLKMRAQPGQETKQAITIHSIQKQSWIERKNIKNVLERNVYFSTVWHFCIMYTVYSIGWLDFMRYFFVLIPWWRSLTIETRRNIQCDIVLYYKYLTSIPTNALLYTIIY